jgi:hypothetical protein
LVNSSLKVELGFAPPPSSEYLVLQNDGTDPIIGAFASWTTAKASYGSTLYQFGINYAAGDGNDIALTRQGISILGDCNGNGVVDSADYILWRKSWGKFVAPYFGADGSGDGIVNDADLVVWRANFGNTFNGSGAAANESPASVPEPNGVLLVCLALIAVPIMHRRKHAFPELVFASLDRRQSNVAFIFRG